MKKLHFEIKINSPVQKVWHTMLDDKTYREWASVFMPGSHYEGSWETGSDIRFLAPDENGNLGGMVSKIVENRPYEFISIKHIGMFMNGVEDTSSDEIKKWGDVYENYTFTEENGITTVKVDLDTADDWADMFEDMWPKALDNLKKISEHEG